VSDDVLREVDREVARAVMGWTEFERVADEHGERMGLRPDGYRDFVPRYSGDVAAAWKVVERIIAQGGCPEYRFSEGEHFWRFLSPWRGSVAFDVASSAAEAICRAALAWVEDGGKRAGRGS